VTSSIRKVELIHNVKYFFRDYQKTVYTSNEHCSGERVLRAVALTSLVFYLETFGVRPEDIFSETELKEYKECRVIAILTYAKSYELKDFEGRVMQRIAL